MPDLRGCSVLFAASRITCGQQWNRRDLQPFDDVVYTWGEDWQTRFNVCTERVCWAVRTHFIEWRKGTLHEVGCDARGTHAAESWVTELVNMNPNYHDVFFLAEALCISSWDTMPRQLISNLLLILLAHMGNELKSRVRGASPSWSYSARWTHPEQPEQNCLLEHLNIPSLITCPVSDIHLLWWKRPLLVASTFPCHKGWNQDSVCVLVY